MKKRSILSAILSVVLLLVAAGCGGESSALPSSEAPATSPADSIGASMPSVNYPTKNISLIIPQNAGGDTDIVGRMFASMMEKELGVSVVCNNQPGGSTAVGLTALLAASPDGYTLALSATNIALLKASGYADIDYTNFKPICGINYDSCLLLTRGDETRFSTVAEIIDYAKQNPGELRIGTGSAGGVWHLGVINFCNATGIDAVVIPTDGGGGGVGITLLNKDIDIAILSVGGLASSIDVGDIKVVGVLSDEREAFYPDVPTLKEEGFNVTSRSSRGMVAHADTPPEIIAVLEAAAEKVVNSNEFQTFLDNMNATKMWMNATDYGAFLAEENEIYPPLVEAAGMGG